MKKIVVLDPGHGGSDPGAINRKAGIEEADMALDVCLRAEALLKPYVQVLLTRRADVFKSLSSRPALANSVFADCFVSYHFNSSSSEETASSWEIFSTPGQNNSDKLATAIGEAHGKLFPDQRARKDESDGDLDKEANFLVIRKTHCPSVLMEGEFINTPHGAARIKNPAERQKMALAVAIGVLDFLVIPHQLGSMTPQAAIAVGEGEARKIPNLKELASRGSIIISHETSEEMISESLKLQAKTLNELADLILTLK